MPFDYYRRLNQRQKRVYQRSDGIVRVELPHVEMLHDTVIVLQQALAEENRARIQKLSNQLLQGISQQLNTPIPQVKVLARRPSDDWGELHGLYEPADEGGTALITVWMRTAKRKQVVAFKTFLRTLLHEMLHHLDYEYFGLQESFHTEGFYKRENNLFQSLTSSAQPTVPFQYELSLGSRE